VSVYVLEFDYTSPPLTANQRMHWREKAKITAKVRAVTYILARAHQIPPLGKCWVGLTWFVTDGIRRDADNVVPTLKAMCDGLVDALVVADDTPDLMTKFMPEIVRLPKEDGPARMTLRIEKIS